MELGNIQKNKKNTFVFEEKNNFSRHFFFWSVMLGGGGWGDKQ